MNIGERIKELRISKAMTQSELSGTQITRNMLSCIERGTAQPSIDTLCYLAGKLKVPVGYLLAEDGETFAYRKLVQFPNAKQAFASGDYKTCRAICEGEFGTSGDDEIAYLLAECNRRLAFEAFEAGKLHTVCECLDASLADADRTVYYTRHIKTTAVLCFRYLEEISPALSSNRVDTFGMVPPCDGTSPLDSYFCAYHAWTDGNFPAVNHYLEDAEPSPYRTHLHVLLLMSGKAYEQAVLELTELLRDGEPLPDVLRYHVYGCLEVCNRETGDYKSAYEQSKTKVRVLEKMLEAQ